MPVVNTKLEDTAYDGYTNNILLTYIKNNHVHFIYLKSGELGDHSILRPGQKLIMYGKDRGNYINKKIPLWKTGAEYNRTKLCFGQSILVSAPPGGGKTSAVTAIARSYEMNPEVVSYRMLIGERMDDSLYASDELEDKTINCDSSAPIEVQLRTVYITLTNALKDAYDGRHVILAVDSLTRMIMSLTGLYSSTHMQSGGISFDVLNMVSNLFKLGGGYLDGTLTIIATCLYSPSNNTWKAIYTELSASANAEIQVARSARNPRKSILNTSTRRSEAKVYPYFTLGGYRFYY